MRVVITGASSGIGRATAIRFAREGVDLVLGARGASALDELAEACAGFGGEALPVPTDIADEAAVQRLAAVAAARPGGFDVWVNNASVYAVGAFEETPAESFRRVIEVNLLGTANGARAALAQFRRQGHGVLINVSSVLGVVPAPYVNAYSASTHAVRALSASLRQELRAEPEIHVVTVLPATIDTPIFGHAANFSGRAIRPISPVYRAEKVAAAIVGLATRPRREVTVGWAGSLLAALHSLLPGPTEALVARQVGFDAFGGGSAASGPGNLFAPAGGSRISGGWRTGLRSHGRMALVALGVAVPGAVAWRLRRR